MNNQMTQATPVLDPPGRGLPRYELRIAKILIGLRGLLMTRPRAVALFARERAQIVNLARSVTPEDGSRRVLIDRPRGLEDSSRYWSVFMTIEHLRIVNEGAGRIISLLARGQTPERIVSTSDVKPAASVDASVIDRFEQVCDAFEATVVSIGDLRTNLRWPHPWFGPLNASQWHFFTGVHMGLHRRQIEMILSDK
jgi:hypothetical protein